MPRRRRTLAAVQADIQKHRLIVQKKKVLLAKLEKLEEDIYKSQTSLETCTTIENLFSDFSKDYDDGDEDKDLSVCIVTPWQKVDTRRFFSRTLTQMKDSLEGLLSHEQEELLTSNGVSIVVFQHEDLSVGFIFRLVHCWGTQPSILWSNKDGRWWGV